jgi:phosphatidylserine/phosphatidylglycerophosphate/cardiolipin synthase-like enzyme
MLHAKVSVLGDKLTLIGSWNMDNRSASHDSEDVCAIYDPDIAKQMTEQLMKDMFEQSYELSLDSIKKRSLDKEIRSAAMLLMGELA